MVNCDFSFLSSFPLRGTLDRKRWPQGTELQTLFFGNIFRKTNGDESWCLTAHGKRCVCVWKMWTSWLNYIIWVIQSILSLMSSHQEIFFFWSSRGNNNKKNLRCLVHFQIQPPAPAGGLSVLIEWNITIANRKLQNKREKIMRGNQGGRKKGNFLAKRKSPWLKILNVAFCFVSFKGNNGTVKSLLERLSCKQFQSVHSMPALVLGAFSTTVASPGATQSAPWAPWRPRGNGQTPLCPLPTQWAMQQWNPWESKSDLQTEGTKTMWTVSSLKRKLLSYRRK